jgi:hypothetical protein
MLYSQDYFQTKGVSMDRPGSPRRVLREEALQNTDRVLNNDALQSESDVLPQDRLDVHFESKGFAEAYEKFLKQRVPDALQRKALLNDTAPYTVDASSEGVNLLTDDMKNKLRQAVNALNNTEQMDVNWQLSAVTIEGLDQQNTKGNEMFLSMCDLAWGKIRTCIDHRVLNAVVRPRIQITKMSYPYYRPDCLYVRIDETPSQIAHEFGHHLENYLDIRIWLSLIRLLQHRSNRQLIRYEGDGVGAKPPASRGGEIQYRAAMPTTGNYSALYYEDDGATEVVSRSLEYLFMGYTFQDFVEGAESDMPLALILLRAFWPFKAMELGLWFPSGTPPQYPTGNPPQYPQNT